MSESFAGISKFVWFVGVVEDRMDPEYAGRLRVRCLAHHTADKTLIPTEDLMWASPIFADGGISGLGSSPGLFVEGTHVMGYFRDGLERQEPVILGTLPGAPVEYAQSGGFYDPNGTYPKYINEPDVNRLAVNKKDGTEETNPHLSLVLRRLTRTTNIATSEFTLDTTAADNSDMGASLETTWSQPTIPYNASYPYNHVYESESGHIREYDDTNGAERIHERHRTGTSYEIDESGNKTELTVSNHYNIIKGSSQALIEGLKDLSIDGHYKLYINKSGSPNNHYDIQVGAGANVNIQVDSGNVNITTGGDGKINLNSGGDYNVKVGGDYTMTVAGSRSVSVAGTTTDNTSGAVVHTGKTIDLN